ncbi:GNAT family N-acetyltransferase [Lentibacillus sp. L22]|uniref:GNAT family N-acetyltransferase n=1 Tax=Lentibacillus TaxID=175304 RepID=UPI0022B0F513|nr:GNAT family N-acetyltransferase [Lentibacillus daqui]
MKIRKAYPSDVSDIKNLCVKGVQIAFENVYTQIFIDKSIEIFYNHERIQKEISSYLVAEDDSDIIGCISCGINEMRGELFSQIYAFHVVPTKRRNGIGGNLLETASNYLRKKKIKRQYVSVLGNNDNALPFYYAMGFIEASRHSLEDSINSTYSLDLMRNL